MIGIDFYLFGYFLIQPKKEQTAAVFDLLLQKKISVKKAKGDLLIVRQRYRKILAPYLDSMGVAYTKNKGLPEIMYENRKRYSVFAAAFLCIFLFLFLNSRVFDVRILGEKKDANQEVLSALSREGLYPGASFHSLDFSEIENGLKQACPSVAWINLHRRGTVVYVNFIEREEGDASPAPSLSNLVAKEDGIIVAVSPGSGVANVKVGDAVKAGDLLVSAVHPDGTVSGATGEVLARVEGEIFAKAAYRESKTALQRQKNVEITLNFFGFSINIFKNYRNLPSGCDIIENNRQLQLLGRASLPISLSFQTAYLPKEETVVLTEEEVMHLAQARLNAAMSELLPLGEIVSLQTEGTFTDEGYIFTLHYAQIRNIAEPKPIRTSDNG